MTTLCLVAVCSDTAIQLETMEVLTQRETSSTHDAEEITHLINSIFFSGFTKERKSLAGGQTVS